MAVQTESPTLGRGTDWNSFYGTEPLEANDPFSPSAFGQLLFAEPDAASARDLLGIADAIGAITFADIGGTIGLDQLPPGSLITVDDIGEDALYFFTESTGLPSLISADSTVSFISGHIAFSDLTGTISVDQFPPGSVASLDSIDQDALYFFDNTLFAPKLIGADDTAAFLSGHLSFSDLSDTISLGQFPPGTVVSIDSIDEDALYFFDNTLFAPRLINAADTLTFLGITSGGSFLVSNTARVDPSGNDSTGTIGDLGKPFVTVQAIINAAQTASLGNISIQIGTVGTSEALTVASLTEINFSAVSAFVTNAFASLTYTDPTNGLNLHGVNTSFGSVSAATTNFLNIVLNNASCGNVTNTAGPVSVYSDVGTCQVGNVTANGQLELDGGIVDGGTASAPGFPVYIVNCKTTYLSSGSTDYSDAITVDSAGSTVYVTNSVLAAVTAAATLHLKDSRVQGANNATTTIYEDLLLSGDDTAYDATSWNGDTRTPTKNAVRDKFESLNISNWDTAFTERHQWDGGATNLVAATGRTSLGLVIGTNVQAWDADLDALAALSGTNNIYYRSAANTWSSVTIGAGLSFSAGSLTATVGGTITLSGDVTGSGTTAITTTLANIPTGTPAVGTIFHTNIAAPSSPASGKVSVYSDSTDLRFHDKNASGVIGTTVVADTGSSNNFLTAISAAGIISKAQPSFSNLSGSVAASQMPALTGDVTTSAGAVAATLVNIPTAVTMAGYLAATAIVAPGTPGAGIGRIYVDSTSKNLAVKDDAGVIKHGVQTKTSVASNFLTAISDAGVVSAAQPADSDISFTDITTGNASTSQHGFMLKYPGGTSTFLRADGTFAAPAGGGTVTSIATTSPISGGTITGSGTLSLLVNVDHAFTAAQSVTTAPAANTAGTGFLITDTTTASSGNQQYSPALRWTGQGWKTNATAASQAVDFRAYVVPVQGAANPSAYWTLESSINAGSFGNAFNLFSSGGIGVGNSTDPGIGVMTWAAGQAVTQNTTAPTQASGSVAGANFGITASSATAGSSSAGAAAGGAIVLTTGNAARLTSGNANGGNITLTPGTGIGTGVSGIVEQRNGTNAQTFAIYNTFTDASNYEYGNLSWASNSLNIGTVALGTGTARNTQLMYAGGATAAIKISGPTTRIILGNGPTLSNAFSSGLVNISDGQSWTPTSGTNVGLDITLNAAPSSTSTMNFYSLRIKPTINYSAGTPGAGNYEAVKIAVTETALPTGTNYLIRASAGSGGSTDKFAITNAGLASVYNGITTAGVGNPYIVAAGRVTAQSAANASISTYTTPASDGSYEVSMNMNVTAATALSTSLNCNYTDESNTARTMIFPVTGLTGSFLAGGLVTATGAFETPVMHIRCKASTAITLYTATGTFTSVTYTAEGNIIQTK